MNKHFQLHNDDCINVLKDMDDNSVDSIVTDPPYGLSKEPDPYEVLKKWVAEEDYEHKHRGFMGAAWDGFIIQPRVWKECLRVLKPGGHLICFASARTYDWMCMSIRLGGFEIRDQIMWIYGTGMAQGMNIGKAIDKLHKGTPFGKPDPESPNHNNYGSSSQGHGSKYTKNGKYDSNSYEYTSDVAEQWKGWNTKLKPAHEPIVLARKPVDKSIAENVLEHGTGGMNIDDCRVETTESLMGGAYSGGGRPSSMLDQKGKAGGTNSMLEEGGGRLEKDQYVQPKGRFPANVVHDGSEEVTEHFPLSKGQQGDVKGTEPSRTGGEGTNCYGEYGRIETKKRNEPISSAARFFYCAKASKADRSEGLEDFEEKPSGKMQKGMKSMEDKSSSETRTSRNHHPTVKPTALCKYLCRLITPPNGIILDPFMGSGSTGKAAMLEGFKFIGIEKDTEEGYFQIAETRIQHAYDNSDNKVEIDEEPPVESEEPVDDITQLFKKK